MGRRYRQLRSYGQHLPALTVPVKEAVCLGVELLAGADEVVDADGEVSPELVAPLWRVYGPQILSQWAADYARANPGKPVPTPWAARVLDGEPQRGDPDDYTTALIEENVRA